MIKVYDSTEVLFENNGIKTLHPLLAEVYKADNDDYYAELRDTIENIEYYQQGNIVRIPTPWGVQGFRCENPTIKNNRVEVKAWHLSYDAKLYVIRDANVVDKNCNDALDHINNATDRPTPFTTTSNITKTLSTRIVRKTLFDAYSEFIAEGKYGGHWYRDNFTLGIRDTIGEDRGVVLANNKNITNMEVSEDWNNVCTKILPYTTDGEVAITLDETYIELEEELYDTVYTRVVKFENELIKEDYETEAEFKTATKEWLKTQAENYIEANKLPKIYYSVEAELENVSDVGDTIYIKHSKCKVDITTNVISVVYDAIRNKYVKINFGNFKKELKNLSQEIVSTANEHSEELAKENKNYFDEELEKAGSKLNSILGKSYVVNEDGTEIIIVDRLPKEEAVNCLRFNSAGIGFSNTGYYGKYNSAWTIDGTMDLQQMKVINLVADLIKGGTLKLGGVNNSSGILELYDEAHSLIGEMTKNGFKMYGQEGSYVLINEVVGFAGYDKNDNKIYWADKDEFHMKKSVVEEEITLCNKMRFIPITITDDEGKVVNDGIGLVSANV